ncbi:MAG: Rab family GTPase [Candidatus Hodarchaeota archaeon]
MNSIFPEHFLRICILADEGVGKHILLRDQIKCLSPFKEDHMRTIGVQIVSKDIIINKKSIKISFFMLGMKDYFSPFYRTYCLGADGAIIMYDITNSKTLERISEWVQLLRKSAGNIPIMLVGNKVDLKSREITTEEAIKTNDKFDLSGFYEISAKTGANVEEMFRKVVKLTLSNRGIVH